MAKQQKKEQKKFKSNRKAGVIGFGVTVLIYALIFPFYRLKHWIIGGLLGLLVAKVASIMFTSLDLTTHNKPRPGEKVDNPVEELPLSGDSAADEVIAKGQEMLHQIRAENDAISDEILSGQMDEMERLCVQIFKTVAEKPGKAPQIRKFMNYYLPTTLKMLSSYRTMDSRGVSVDDMTTSRSETIRGMTMILTACQKQLDNLYKDTMLDVSTDIDVLEQMLKRDGLAGGEFIDTASRAAQTLATAREQAARTASGATQAAAQTAQTAASATTAQMNATEPQPLILEIPSSKDDDDFVSFYSKERNNQH